MRDVCLDITFINMSDQEILWHDIWRQVTRAIAQIRT